MDGSNWKTSPDQGMAEMSAAITRAWRELAAAMGFATKKSAFPDTTLIPSFPARICEHDS